MRDVIASKFLLPEDLMYHRRAWVLACIDPNHCPWMFTDERMAAAEAYHAHRGRIRERYEIPEEETFYIDLDDGAICAVPESEEEEK